MFQFTGFPLPYGSDSALPLPDFSIRISTDQDLLAVPRGFSQLTASFIGLWRLGIRRMPLVA